MSRENFKEPKIRVERAYAGQRRQALRSRLKSPANPDKVEIIKGNDYVKIPRKQEESLERVQKSALKIILNNKYLSYSNACDTLNIVNLKSRRQQLFERFTAKYKSSKIHTTFQRKHQ